MQSTPLHVGTAQIDITPPVGAELCGFARRVQPSIGVLDPLCARCLFLEQGSERLLWIHCDLIGVEREFVQSLRRFARDRWGLAAHQVMVSATHTHSGPATITLQEAGAYDAEYVRRLRSLLEEAASWAMERPHTCDVVAVEGHLDLAVDRRGKQTPHTDPRVGAVGFRNSAGEFVAVIVNYPMHAVALGPMNRCISADIPGHAASALRQRLRGEPVVLVTNGACGNLNPPAENVGVAQVSTWAAQVAEAVGSLLVSVTALPQPAFQTRSQVLELPLDALSVPQIEAYADRVVNDPKSLAEWGDRFRRAVDHWRRTLTNQVLAGRADSVREAELFAVRIGELTLLGINAEVFSRFTDDLRAASGRPLYVVGYANGDLGYIPTRAAYDEGGYEVDIAHIFYCGYRPKAGGLELLADQAAVFLRDIRTT